MIQVGKRNPVVYYRFCTVAVRHITKPEYRKTKRILQDSHLHYLILASYNKSWMCSTQQWCLNFLVAIPTVAFLRIGPQRCDALNWKIGKGNFIAHTRTRARVYEYANLGLNSWHVGFLYLTSCFLQRREHNYTILTSGYMLWWRICRYCSELKRTVQ